MKNAVELMNQLTNSLRQLKSFTAIIVPQLKVKLVNLCSRYSTKQLDVGKDKVKSAYKATLPCLIYRWVTN